MTPFYLSRTSAQASLVVESLTPSVKGCYALFNEPQGHFLADYAVLISYPLGQEYVRSHRALRSIAAQLAQKGIPSLRFDYQGTGDSSGNLFDLETALDDLAMAAHWLKEETGLPIKILSVRFGALLASYLAHSIQPIASIYWDPVVDGPSYLEALESLETSSFLKVDGAYWVNGYCMTERLWQSIHKLSLLANQNYIEEMKQHLDQKIFVVGANKSKSYEAWVEQLKTHQISFSEHLSHELIEGQAWGSVNAIGGFINPQAILTKILELVSEEGIAS